MTGLSSTGTLKALLFAGLPCVAAMLAAGPARASISSCSVSSAGIAFPAYDTVTKAQVDSTGTITVTCTGSGNENLSLNLTGGYTGSCSPRQMRNGGDALGYQVYRNAARTQAFCDGGNRLDISINFGGGSTQTHSYTMYGRVTANQNPAWGNGYSDSLTVALKRGGNTLATGTAPIYGSVTPTCSVSAGTLGFGGYVQTAASLSTATVSVNCSNGAPYQVSLAGGQNLSGTVRRMAAPGGYFLSYELFSDALRTAAWGDGGALGAKVSGTGSGGAQNLIVYGRVPAGQAAAPGSYDDSVIVTVEY